MSYDNFILGAPYSKVYVTLTFENHETVKFDGKLIALLTFTSNPSFTEVRDFFNSKTNLQYTIGDFVYYPHKYEYSFCCILIHFNLSFQYILTNLTEKDQISMTVFISFARKILQIFYTLELTHRILI